MIMLRSQLSRRVSQVPEEEAEAREESRKEQGAFQLLNIDLQETV